MGIFQGIMDELPSFEKYWTQIFQNKSMPVVSECQSNMFPLYRLRNDLFLPKDNTKKETSVMIGEMAVTATKALLANIRDGENPRRSICRVLGSDYVGIIHPIMTTKLVCSKWQSIIPLKDILA